MQTVIHAYYIQIHTYIYLYINVDGLIASERFDNMRVDVLRSARSYLHTKHVANLYHTDTHVVATSAVMVVTSAVMASCWGYVT